MKVMLRRGPNVLGVKTGADIDTDMLAPAEAEEVRRLVDDAQIPTGGRESGTVVPDQREVTLRIESEDRELNITFPEGQTPSKLEPLLEYLDQHAKIIPTE